jgi:hypothetical protein
MPAVDLRRQAWIEALGAILLATSIDLALSADPWQST